MTSLRGNLNSVDLANIFQMLSMNQREGTLYIFDGQSRKAIYFGLDGVSMLTRGKCRPDTIGRILIRFDKLTPAQLQAALAVQEKTEGRRLGEILIDQGTVSQADINNALKTQIEEEVYSLFLWKDAQFEFVEGPPESDFLVADGGVTKLTFNVNSLIMEAAKRVDEWEWIQRVLQSNEEILKYTGRNAPLEDEIFSHACASKVLASIDGRRNVDEIVAASYAGRFEVTKILALLMESGAVEPAHVIDLQRAARDSVVAGDMGAAVKFLSKLVVLRADTPEMHRQLAEAFETRQQLERAAFHYKVHGEVLAQNGDRPAAFAVYRRIVEFLPTDLAAVDRAVEIFTSSPDGLEQHAAWVIGVGKTTAEAWVELRRPSRAIQILHRVVALGPSDGDLRNRLIQVYLQSGMNSDAIAEYDAIAETAMAMRDFEGAERIYRKILAIDRTRDDAQAKLNQIISKRKLRQRGIRIGVGLAIVLVAGSFAGIQGWEAYREKQRGETAVSAAFGTRYATMRSDTVAVHGRIGEAMNSLQITFGDAERAAAALIDGAPARAALVEEANLAAGNYFKLAAEFASVRESDEANVAGNAIQGKLRDLSAYEAQLRQYVQDRVDSGWDDVDARWVDLHLRELSKNLERLLHLAKATPSWLTSGKGMKAQSLAANVNSVLAGYEAMLASVADARARQDVAGQQTAVFAFLEEHLKPTGLYDEILLPRTVVSHPAGARIFVDDRDTGQLTPAVIDLPLARDSKVHLVSDGFQAYDFDVPALRTVIRQSLRSDVKLEFDVVLRKDVVVQTQGTPDRISAAPTIVADRLYVPTRGKTVDVFDSQKGTKRGTVAVPSVVRVAEAGGVLLVVGTDRQAYFVRVASGEIIGREPLGGNVQADPVVIGEQVVVADLDGHITAYAPRTQSRTWRYERGDGALSSFATTPILDGADLIATSVDGRVHVIDPQTGIARRTMIVAEGGVPVRFSTSAVPCGTELLAISRGDAAKPSTLYAFDRLSGQLRWKHAIDGDARWAPHVWQGVAYIVTAQGDIVGVRCSEQPAETAVAKMAASVTADSLLVDGILYVGDRTGTLAALDVRGATIERAWDFRVVGRDGKPSPITTRPVVVADMVYVGDDATIVGLRR